MCVMDWALKNFVSFYGKDLGKWNFVLAFASFNQPVFYYSLDHAIRSAVCPLGLLEQF